MYRKQTRENMSFLAFILVLMSITIGYAIIETDLNIDGVGVIRENTYNLYDYVAKQAIRDDKASTYVTSSMGISFTDISSNTNGKGIYMISSTENDEYPIYYYRGNVDDNNVIFAGFCWQIVRTTKTGGTKLIYNGVPNNGVCDATGENSVINVGSPYNHNITDKKYVGYMYDSDDDGIDDADSNIKSRIDTWYAENLIKYTKLLEDTEWCNNRNISSETETTLYYEGYANIINGTPSLYCTNDQDKFTVGDSGNSLLKYPIGLLTADETLYAGATYSVNQNYYLYIGIKFWLMTPFHFENGDTARMFYENIGRLYGAKVYNGQPIRPAISLRHDITFLEGGVGTKEKPLIIKDYILYDLIEENTVLDNSSSTYVTNDTGIDFTQISSDTNGKGVYTIADTKEYEYPILYYRGAVEDNYVIFGGFCWKIVRTTETGGVKLIYNGIPSNNSCLSIRDAATIGVSAYNIDESSNEFVGYMYENNSKNSTAKQFIEDWYNQNMNSYTAYLEDTVFCSDRTILETGTDTNGGEYINYLAYERMTTGKPSLECSSENDSFQVNNTKAKLNFPVGLITADEALYAGAGYGIENKNYYLFNSLLTWTMTPCSSDSARQLIFRVNTPAALTANPVTGIVSIRPVVSLKLGTVVISGDGTSTNPYIVET